MTILNQNCQFFSSKIFFLIITLTPENFEGEKCLNEGVSAKKVHIRVGSTDEVLKKRKKTWTNDVFDHNFSKISAKKWTFSLKPMLWPLFCIN
jgi:hypothetical protein